MQQTINGECTELAAFAWEHHSVCLKNHFPPEAVCCIDHPHGKHEQDCFLGHYCFTFFLGRFPLAFLGSIPFFRFSSLADGLKYSETPKYSEQYFRDQDSGTKVNI